MGRRRQRLPKEPFEAHVEGLSHEGRGIAHVNDKIVFIDGALPGEHVRFRYTRRRSKRDEGITDEVLDRSSRRIDARCPHFGTCGGCSLQHMSTADQIAHKGEVLAEHFRHMGDVQPERWLTPLMGPIWGYRRKARLGVKYVPRKDDRVLIGFREKHSPFVADIHECHVLDERVASHLAELSSLIRSLDNLDRVPQIEVAAGDDAVGLIFRNLAEWSDGDRQTLIEFGQRTGLFIYEQPGNESTVRPVWPTEPQLSYELPSFGVRLCFEPTDFVQVNQTMNRAIVDQAVEFLAPEPDSRVLDLFCGLGNFSLPLATRSASVIGVEGERTLVERARENAARNDLAERTAFHTADLTADLSEQPWLAEGVDRVLLDPPRSGAAEVLPAVAQLAPERIVYVACGPATLARDAGSLVHEHGYRLNSAGVMDMFPHTAHVESMAVFERR
jgi:23S rRNA (uracil1939-C5)-methyltransferase